MDDCKIVAVGWPYGG